MGGYTHSQLLPYRSDQLYDMVADVGQYPQFLPGCRAATILSQSETELVASLTVAYGPLQETYSSRVHLTPKSRIDVEYIEGPFRHLTNYWTFHDHKDGLTKVDFYIDFKFQNTLFQKASQMVFQAGFEKILQAFEERACQLYGS